MSVLHHPDQTLLLSHAAGALDPAMALIMATHLSVCAQCQAEMALGERLGGVLLDDIAPEPLADDALARVMARLDVPGTATPPSPSNDNTPAPLRAFLGRDLSEVRWRSMGPRLGYVTLYRRGALTMRLLRGAPGADTGRHTHRDKEYTLVLKGGYSDETGRYGPGDFQAVTSAVTHNPVADPGEDCINLAVTIGRLRFTGAVQNVVATLFGF